MADYVRKTTGEDFLSVRDDQLKDRKTINFVKEELYVCMESWAKTLGEKVIETKYTRRKSKTSGYTDIVIKVVMGKDRRITNQCLKSDRATLQPHRRL